MMSSKGAIKRSSEPRSHSKSRATKAKATELEEKAERRERRREREAQLERKSQVVQKVNTTVSSQDRREKRQEPQIVDSRSVGDRRSRTGKSLGVNILPDKNPLKSRKLSRDEHSTSNSSIDRSAGPASLTKKQTPVKARSDGFVKSENAKSSVNSKMKTSSSQRSVKEKSKALYDEVRGSKSIYAPQDANSKLRSMIKSTEVSSRREGERSRHSKQSDKPQPRLSSRERKSSRTLSPSEVKVLNTVKYNSKSYESDEEETAPKVNSDQEHKSEDEFEDYESDFEENISEVSDKSDPTDLSIDLEPIELQTEQKKRTIVSANIRRGEEEHMLDSGHYDLSEARKRAAMVGSVMINQIRMPSHLSEIKENNNQPYREEKQSEVKSLPSSTDEGFEDLRSGDFVKSPPTSHMVSTNSKTSKSERRNMGRRKAVTRGQILMNMIKLDTVEWSLYESHPISYDEFIRTYGKLNTQQISTQTNEDNLDIGIQTDVTEFTNKWTQFPVKCRNKLQTIEDVRLFKTEHIGVGGDSVENIPLKNPSYDVLRLNEFLSKAGKVVLALLEEKESGGNILQQETHEFPFSEGCIKLSINSLPFLCGRQISMMCYSEINNKILLTIHAPSKEKIEPENKQDYVMNSCIGCVWNINEPSRPIKLFYSQSPIATCCFHCTNNNIIFAGLQDGSICIWDLREEESWHHRVFDKVNEMDWIIRGVTYTTAGNWEIEAHKSSVVAIRIVSKMDQDETENLNDKFVSIQICSLDEDGNLIIWSVLRNLNVNSDDLGLTQWGKVKLIKSQEVPLFIKKNDIKKQFIDMNVDKVDSNNLYLATNGTDILYANCVGARNNTLYYRINEMNSCGSTTCIEVCPFKQSYFFAGCNDGSMRLHYLNIETPILKLKDENSSAGIKSIQWSKSKPLTIYVLDEHSRISVWDLKNSDIHPTHTVSTKTWGSVKCMELSPCNTNRDMLNQYLALGTDTGNVEIHKLKKNYYFSKQDDFLQEMDTFLRYVTIL